MLQKKRITKRIKHIYIITQKSGVNILLNIKFKNLQKIPLKYIVINKNKFHFSSLYSKQLFQQKAVRAYYGYIGKRYLKMLYIKAKKYNIHRSKIFKQFIEFKLDRFLVKIWFLNSIYQAKQYILHKQVLISNKCITNSSYVIKHGDIITLKKNNLLSIKKQLSLKFINDNLISSIFIFNNLSGIKYIYTSLINYYIYTYKIKYNILEKINI